MTDDTDDKMEPFIATCSSILANISGSFSAPTHAALVIWQEGNPHASFALMPDQITSKDLRAVLDAIIERGSPPRFIGPGGFENVQ